ncbi:SIR2 family protein, partial [candidate division WOR-3 bacterium]|nr:SIR2 family protein [candidate division WOR-3 bacterium]
YFSYMTLGAGASNPYGFPLGDELKDIILAQLNTTDPLIKKLNVSAALVNEFWKSLRSTFHPNIDIFLEKQTNFRELGSHILAITIMLLEHKSHLFPQKDWYGDLYNTLELENEESDTANLVIVTINYDRSLEHFLTGNINYNCQEDLKDLAHENRRKIKIVHAHGSLGKYPNVYYGPSPTDIEAVKNAAARIKIVSDRLEDSPDFKEAQVTISQAEHIIFLGFGYDVRILDTLLAKTDLKGKKIYGTTYKLDKKKRGFLADYFDNQITLGDNNQGCQAFLKLIGLTR